MSSQHSEDESESKRSAVEPPSTTDISGSLPAIPPPSSCPRTPPESSASDSRLPEGGGVPPRPADPPPSWRDAPPSTRREGPASGDDEDDEQAAPNREGDPGATAQATAVDAPVPGDFDSMVELPSLLLGSLGSGTDHASSAGLANFGSSLEGVSRQASSAARRALHRDEATRAAAFARSLAALVGFTMLSLFYLGGPRWLVIHTELWLGILLTTSLWVANRAATPKRYTRFHFRVFAVACTLAAVAIEYYLGVFSPTPLVVTLGISFLATGEDRLFAVGIPILAGAGYLVLACLIIFAVIPDLGRLTSDGVPTETKLFFAVMAPAAMIMTAWVARRGRKIIYGAIENAHQAALLAGMREAQLAEVKEDLDAALNAGAGVGGRYTGAMMGDYSLGAIIGRGAMGEVYSAKEVSGSRLAAVKLLVQGVARDPTLLARFKREGEITRALKSPYLVKVFDAGTAPDGAAYIAMELLEGRDLSWYLRRKGTFSLADALMLCEHVSRGLDAAHAAGIVHRDIKPRNLFLAEVEGQDERWKILDFGVAKLVRGAGSLTHSRLVGTPGYMAPEQAEARKIDARADIFALGAVLYRVLTGRPAFTGDGPAQILYEVVHRHPQRPSKLVPELSKQLEHFLAIALAKDPRHRFASGAELFNAFRAAAAERLPEGLERRAVRLLEAQPWGSVIRSEGRELPASLSSVMTELLD